MYKIKSYDAEGHYYGVIIDGSTALGLNATYMLSSVPGVRALRDYITNPPANEYNDPETGRIYGYNPGTAHLTVRPNELMMAVLLPRRTYRIFVDVLAEFIDKVERTGKFPRPAKTRPVVKMSAEWEASVLAQAKKLHRDLVAIQHQDEQPITAMFGAAAPVTRTRQFRTPIDTTVVDAKIKKLFGSDLAKKFRL